MDDLSSPRVRLFLQQYFEGRAETPLAGSADEYAHYFEACYPNEADRRTYIEARVRGGRPSFGTAGLAALVKAEFCQVIWTTYFDRTIEDAITSLSGTTAVLRVVSAETSPLAKQAIAEQAFPLLVKLHGDFHSRRLKNTLQELREQDSRLRLVFKEELLRRGLAVVGYSGRDD